MDTGCRRCGKRIAGVFASLRVQIILILLACYLIPSLTLSIFIQTTLIPGLKEISRLVLGVSKAKYVGAGSEAVD